MVVGCEAHETRILVVHLLVDSFVAACNTMEGGNYKEG